MHDEPSLATCPDPAPPPGSAAEAFSDLAARVAVMEERLDRRMAVMARALEHIAGEKQAIDIPDYGNTLAKIAKSLAVIEGKPALQMTPEDMAARMEAAAAEARRDDRATLSEAKRNQADILKDLRTVLGSADSINEHNSRLRWWAGIGFVLGCLAWSAIPGFFARVVPTNWHWPERIAARTVREATLWDAGTRLMRADSPEAWQALTDAVRMRDDNRETIDACQERAIRTRQPARCVITITARAGSIR